MIRIGFYSLSLLLVAGLACRDSTGPDDDWVDPRTYTWTADTLAYPESFQTMMEDIWGSSPKDVYVVGHNSEGLGQMYRFDDKEWTDVKLHTVQGGNIGGRIDLSDIHGFAADDIWAVGERFDYNPNPPPNFLDSSLIIHFDGTEWTEHPIPGGRFLLTVWGISPTDIWAGGIYGTLYHYDGTSWTRFPMPDSLWFGSLTGFASDDVYGRAYNVGALDVATYYILHWDGETWRIEDSFMEDYRVLDKFGRSGLFALEDQLFSVGWGVFKKMKSDSGWEQIFYDQTARFYDLHGSSSDNLFVVGPGPVAYHFNGVDWFKYDQIPNLRMDYVDCWTDGREVFILGTDYSKSYVLHGK